MWQQERAGWERAARPLQIKVLSGSSGRDAAPFTWHAGLPQAAGSWCSLQSLWYFPLGVPQIIISVLGCSYHFPLTCSTCGNVQEQEQAGDGEPCAVGVGQLDPCKPFPSRIAVSMPDSKFWQQDFCLPPSSGDEEDPDAPCWWWKGCAGAGRGPRVKSHLVSPMDDALCSPEVRLLCLTWFQWRGHWALAQSSSDQFTLSIMLVVTAGHWSSSWK